MAGKILLPLDVSNSKEGYRRLSTFFSIMTLLMLTALWCLLYECVLLTVVDRDSRDMTFDYRTTHQGIRRYHRMFATAYWPTSDTQPTDWWQATLRPSLDIPVVVIFVKSAKECKLEGGVDVCRQLENAVNTAVAENPGLIRTVKWTDNNLPVQLQVFVDGQQMPEGLIPAGSVSQEDVDFLISLVIENYVDQYYIPPLKQGSTSPLWNSVQVGSTAKNAVIGMALESRVMPNLRKIGWPRELVYWGFGQCEDTSFVLHMYTGSMNINRPRISTINGSPLVPRLQLYFLGTMQTFVDWYSVDTREDGLVSVAPLSSVQVRVLMIPQDGHCCAWQLVDAVGIYSSSRFVGNLDDIPSFFVSEQVTLRVELHDMAEAHRPYFPRLEGPALIYCGIIMGGISFIMFGLTPILMFLVQYNVDVNHQRPPPWFAYSTKYRGW